MGGAEVFTYEVAKRWAASGHEITLFTSKFPGCSNEEIVDGIKIVRAGGRFTVYGQAKKFYAKRFRREGFDIIIDEINTQPFFAQKFAQNGEKIVALVHQLAREFWFYETPFPVSYIGYHFLESRWLKQYVDVSTVTVSESTRLDLASLGFKHVSVVPEGLNFEPLKVLPEKHSKPIVVFSGRLKRAKRPDHAIKAFAIVNAKIPKAELWIFGDGPFRKTLERTAGSGVKFFGNSNNFERRDLLGKSWILIVPGVREGWGLNVIEANALGVPAVAYDAPGLRDSVRNQETGLLAENGNIKDLAEKTISVLSDEVLRKTLSVNALNYSKQFNWEITACEFMKLIV
jgi:glycosyltransferase involved in cell wall biosynthesis